MDLNRLGSGKKFIDQILKKDGPSSAHKKTLPDTRKNPYTPMTTKK